MHHLIDKEWKGLVKFGRVDATKNKELLKLLPFRIVAYPSIFSYAPTGDFDLLSISSSFHPGEIKRTLKELLGKAVELVPPASVNNFLELGPAYYETRPLTKFKILLLPKKKDPPMEYLRSAMNNLGIASFGIAPSDNRKQILKNLKIDSKMNLIFSYKKFNASGEQAQILEPKDVSIKEMNAIISSLIKHSIIEIYRNNYKHYCSSYENEDKEDDEEKEESRTVCVFALLEGVLEENQKLKNFQRYVHMKFAEKYRKIDEGDLSPPPIQYGTLNLGWHLELREFLKSEDKHLEKDKLNYLIISPDNDAFAVIAPTDCIMCVL